MAPPLLPHEIHAEPAGAATHKGLGVIVVLAPVGVGQPVPAV
ncbi:MAG TPA: hypothetical protein VGZ23_13420 [bacterium]|nr:hypothetical protein [bacterium]